jgi:hypothetical protein
VLTASKKLAEREFIKQQHVNFIAAWSSSSIREVGDKFHCNFKASMQADPFGYRGVNLGSTTFAQKQAQ